jgi:hypothetical protein
MTPEQIATSEWNKCSESSLRAELWLHNLHPSEVIGKQILINMLTEVYFSYGK